MSFYRSHYLRAAGSASVALLLACFATAQTGPYRPTLKPNSQKYRDNGLKNATGRSGAASLTGRALLAQDGKTFLELTTGDLDNPAAAPGKISKVQLKLLRKNGTTVYANYNNLEVGGYFTRNLGGLFLGQPLQVQASVRGIDPTRTDVVTINEKVKLLPDLVAESLRAPDAAHVNTPVNLEAVVRETNRDMGARADCVLYVDGAEWDRSNGIWVDADDSVSCAFTATFDSAGTKRVEVRVANVKPGDYNPNNNSAFASIDVTSEQIKLSYWAYAEDYTARYTDRYDSFYGSTYGGSSETNDWGFARDNREDGQSTYFDAFSHEALTFPINASYVETSDGVTTGTLILDSLEADWTAQYGDYSHACAWRYDPTTNISFSFCSGSDGYDAYSSINYQRFAGRAVYFSSSYSAYWNNSWGSYYFYDASASASDSGTYTGFGNGVTIVAEVTEALTGRFAKAEPTLTLAPVSDGYTHPYSCTEFRMSYGFVRSCSGDSYQYDGKYGSAEGVTP